MFKSNSMIYDINIICKVLCILLMMLDIILLKNTTVLVFLGLILLGISLESKKISILVMIGILFSIASTFYTSIFGISKAIILIAYLCIIKKITNASEMRYLLEVTLYKFQSKRITFRTIYVIYFYKQFKKNMKILERLREEYGMARDFFYIGFTIKKAWKKTKYEMKEIITMNDLRFYNFSKQRSYIEKPRWESWDSKYLFIHLTITIVLLIYGR